MSQLRITIITLGILSVAEAFLLSGIHAQEYTDEVIRACVSKSPDSKVLLHSILSDEPYENALTNWRGVIESGCAIADRFRSGSSIEDWTEVDFSNNIDNLKKTIEHLRSASRALQKNDLNVDEKKIAHWLIAAETSRYILNSFPSRELLARSPFFTAQRARVLDEAMQVALVLTRDLFASGLKLRENLLAQLWASKLVGDSPINQTIRNAASKHITNVKKLQAIFQANWSAACKTHPVIVELSAWCQEHEIGIRQVFPYRVKGLFQSSHSPSQQESPAQFQFVVSDARQLVPWSFALADRMNLGQLRSYWYHAGLSPANSADVHEGVLTIGVKVDFVFADSRAIEVFRGLFASNVTLHDEKEWETLPRDLGQALATKVAANNWKLQELDAEIWNVVHRRTWPISDEKQLSISLEPDLQKPIFATTESGIGIIQQAVEEALVNKEGCALDFLNESWEADGSKLRQAILATDKSHLDLIDVIVALEKVLSETRSGSNYTASTIRAAISPLRRSTTSTSDLQKVFVDELVATTHKNAMLPLERALELNQKWIVASNCTNPLNLGWEKNSPLTQLVVAEIVDGVEEALNSIVEEDSLHRSFFDSLMTWPLTATGVTSQPILDRSTNDWIKTAYQVSEPLSPLIFSFPNSVEKGPRIETQYHSLKSTPPYVQKKLDRVQHKLDVVQAIVDEMNWLTRSIHLLRDCKKELQGLVDLPESAWERLQKELNEKHGHMSGDTVKHYLRLMNLANAILRQCRTECQQLLAYVHAFSAEHPSSGFGIWSALTSSILQRVPSRGELEKRYPDKNNEWFDQIWPEKLQATTISRREYVQNAISKLPIDEFASETATEQIVPKLAIIELPQFDQKHSSISSQIQRKIQFLVDNEQHGITNRDESSLDLEIIEDAKKLDELTTKLHESILFSDDEDESKFKSFFEHKSLKTRFWRGVAAKLVTDSWHLEFVEGVNPVIAEDRAWAIIAGRPSKLPDPVPSTTELPQTVQGQPPSNQNIQVIEYFPGDPTEALRIDLVLLLLKYCSENDVEMPPTLLDLQHFERFKK